jgi:hypothetical protein
MFLPSIHMPVWRFTVTFLLVLMFGITVARAGPKDDIVAVKPGAPLPGNDVPGLLVGGEILDGLGVVRDEVQAGVPEVAREELRSLVRRIDRFDGGEGRLPDSYRAGGDLWLPVRAVNVRISLDAPNLLPRPREKAEGGTVGNLETGGERLDWLPLLRTRTLLEQAQQNLSADQGGRAALARINEALDGVEQTVRFDQPALLGAYYAVQQALAARRPWPQSVRAQLRDAARDLYQAYGRGGLADQVQMAADQLDPDTGTLLDTARSLRERINSGGREAGTGTGPEPPKSASRQSTALDPLGRKTGRPRDPFQSK